MKPTQNLAGPCCLRGCVHHIRISRSSPVIFCVIYKTSALGFCLKVIRCGYVAYMSRVSIRDQRSDIRAHATSDVDQRLLRRATTSKDERILEVSIDPGLRKEALADAREGSNLFAPFISGQCWNPPRLLWLSHPHRAPANIVDPPTYHRVSLVCPGREPFM